MSEAIEDRASNEANEILTQFRRLEALGSFVGEDVVTQKHVFLTLSLINFARREALLYKETEELTQTISYAGPRDKMVPVEGIRIRKEGDYTIVDAEIGGTWVEVIRERSDGEFCHIVEPSGMLARYYAVPQETVE